MTVWALLGWAVTIGSTAALLGVLGWMIVRRRSTAGDFDSSSGFSLERYRPMERLLSPEDFRFVQRAPGYRPEVGARWKRERRRLFRLYLSELKRDFQRLHTEARVMVAESGADSAPLVGVLMRQQVIFLAATLGLEFRLALDWAGIGAVDARPLIELIESMRLDLARQTAPYGA
jgi:hypothetical protein